MGHRDGTWSGTFTSIYISLYIPYLFVVSIMLHRSTDLVKIKGVSKYGKPSILPPVNVTHFQILRHRCCCCCDGVGGSCRRCHHSASRREKVEKVGLEWWSVGRGQGGSEERE